MELILIQPVKWLGKQGERVKVKNGYARNFLIPNRLALEATPQNLKSLEQQQKKEQRQLQQERQQAEELAKKMAEISCTISAEVGDQERLFGSVTAADVARTLQEKWEIAVDKRAIELDEPIRKLGIFTVSIRLHPQVRGQLKVWVVKK